MLAMKKPAMPPMEASRAQKSRFGVPKDAIDALDGAVHNAFAGIGIWVCSERQGKDAVVTVLWQQQPAVSMSIELQGAELVVRELHILEGFRVPKELRNWARLFVKACFLAQDGRDSVRIEKSAEVHLMPHNLLLQHP